jgi:hypothetical protein
VDWARAEVELSSDVAPRFVIRGTTLCTFSSHYSHTVDLFVHISLDCLSPDSTHLVLHSQFLTSYRRIYLDCSRTSNHSLHSFQASSPFCLHDRCPTPIPTAYNVVSIDTPLPPLSASHPPDDPHRPHPCSILVLQYCPVLLFLLIPKQREFCPCPSFLTDLPSILTSPPTNSLHSLRTPHVPHFLPLTPTQRILHAPPALHFPSPTTTPCTPMTPTALHLHPHAIPQRPQYPPNYRPFFYTRFLHLPTFLSPRRSLYQFPPPLFPQTFQHTPPTQHIPHLPHTHYQTSTTHTTISSHFLANFNHPWYLPLFQLHPTQSFTRLFHFSSPTPSSHSLTLLYNHGFSNLFIFIPTHLFISNSIPETFPPAFTIILICICYCTIPYTTPLVLTSPPIPFTQHHFLPSPVHALHSPFFQLLAIPCRSSLRCLPFQRFSPRCLRSHCLVLSLFLLHFSFSSSILSPPLPQPHSPTLSIFPPSATSTLTHSTIVFGFVNAHPQQ